MEDPGSSPERGTISQETLQDIENLSLSTTGESEPPKCILRTKGAKRKRKIKACLCVLSVIPGFEGLGFNLHASKRAPFIELVHAGSPAESAGLQVGDRVVKINDESILDRKYKEVVDMIKSSLNMVKLLVIRQDVWTFALQNKILLDSRLSFIQDDEPVSPTGRNGIVEELCKTDGDSEYAEQKEYQENSEIKIKDDTPTICFDYLAGCCSSEKCEDMHCDLPYQWQFFQSDKEIWKNFPGRANVDLERTFCEPNKEIHFGEYRKIPSFKAHFNEMVVHFIESDIQLDVVTSMRRLSTRNTAESSVISPFFTTWTWYWKDGSAFFKYKNKVSDGSDEDFPDSKKLEECFMNDFHGTLKWSSKGFKYKINFSRMVQINIQTGHEQEVTRRPGQFVDTAVVEAVRKELKEGRQEASRHHEQPEIQDISVTSAMRVYGDLPDFWDSIPGKVQEDLQIVPITKTDKAYYHEYEKIELLFYETMSRANFRILKIQRIQNPHLYRQFQLCKDRMEKNSPAGVDERLLFHGTVEERIGPICHDGFDCRLHGATTGTLFGRGSYFAKSACYSSQFTNTNRLFAARVLVGLYTNGEPHYVRPPPKDFNQPYGDAFDSCVDDERNPTIFVVFRMDQAYPEYLIDFKELGPPYQRQTVSCKDKLTNCTDSKEEEPPAKSVLNQINSIMID